MPSHVVDDLRAAVRARLGPGMRAVRIALGPGRADIVVGPLTRTVPVASWDDAVAIRTIVLHVVDLAQPAPALDALSTPVVVAAAEPVAATPGPGLDLIVAPSFGRGISGSDPWMVGLTAGAALAWGRLRVGASAGWSHGVRRGSGTPEELSHDSWPVRLALSVDVGPVELGASGGAAPYLVTGVQRAAGLTAIGGGWIRYRRPLGGRLALVVDAGVDALSRRVELTLGDRVAYSTPRVAPFAGVGVVWAVRP